MANNNISNHKTVPSNDPKVFWKQHEQALNGIWGNEARTADEEALAYFDSAEGFLNQAGKARTAGNVLHAYAFFAQALAENKRGIDAAILNG